MNELSLQKRARVVVASAQYPLDPLPSFGAYADKIATWVAGGAKDGADLLVFPEYGALEVAATRGLDVAGDLTSSLAAVADAMPDIDALHQQLARQHGLHILAASGPWRCAGGTFVNASRLFAPSGKMGVEEKSILTPFERAWGIAPAPGGAASLKVFKTSLGLIAIAICYDCEFPLLVRAKAAAGAEILLVPSCTEAQSGASRIRAASMARALENGMCVVTSPTVGDAPWSQAVDKNVGAAGIFVPADLSLSLTGVLAEGALNRPGWVQAPVDLAAIRRLTQTGEMRNVADWSLQPGAQAFPTDMVTIESLI